MRICIQVKQRERHLDELVAVSCIVNYVKGGGLKQKERE